MNVRIERKSVSIEACKCAGTGYITTMKIQRLPGKDRVAVRNTGRQCKNPECLANELSRKHVEMYTASVAVSRWN